MCRPQTTIRLRSMDTFLLILNLASVRGTFVEVYRSPAPEVRTFQVEAPGLHTFQAEHDSVVVQHQVQLFKLV